MGMGVTMMSPAESTPRRHGRAILDSIGRESTRREAAAVS
jgi:hypothetical protein